MHILLIAENLGQAQFVQKGLQYENISTDLLPLTEVKQQLEKNILKNDGLFILIKTLNVLENIINISMKHKKILPIIVLANQYDELLETLVQEEKIKYFFTRPFPFRLIAAEMRTLIFQEKEKIIDKIIKVRDLELNRETREIVLNGKSLYLCNKQFALLEFFMSNAGKILSRSTLLENVWDRNANILTNTIDVHISKLREKIDTKNNEKFIRTIPCSGYIFS